MNFSGFKHILELVVENVVVEDGVTNAELKFPLPLMSLPVLEAVEDVKWNTSLILGVVEEIFQHLTQLVLGENIHVKCAQLKNLRNLV